MNASNSANLPIDESTDHVPSIYGQTTVNLFKRQKLEDQFGIRRKPRLASKKMIALVILLEVVIAINWGIIIRWVSAVRDNDIIDFLSVRAGATIVTKEDMKTLDRHMLLYATVFTFLLPQLVVLSIVLDCIRVGCWDIISHIIKIVAVLIYFGGTADAKLTSIPENRKAFKTHYWIAECTQFIFLFWYSASILKTVGRLYPSIFHLRILGRLFRLIVREWFLESLDNFIATAGFLSLLSGVYTYIGLHKDLGEDGGFYMRFMSVSFLLLFMATLLVNFQKHFIINHTHFITVQEFRDHFLQYYAPRKFDRMSANVTTPKRMY